MVDVTNVEEERFPNDEVLISSPSESCAKDVLRTLKSEFSPTSDMDWDSANGDHVEDSSEEDINNTLMERLVFDRELFK